MKLRPDDREAKLWLAAAYRVGAATPEGWPRGYTHGGDVPADYASHVYNDMAMDYFRSRYQGVWFDREAKRTVPVHEAVKTLFPEVAAAYAQRHGATGAAAPTASPARMKGRSRTRRLRRRRSRISILLFGGRPWRTTRCCGASGRGASWGWATPCQAT